MKKTLIVLLVLGFIAILAPSVAYSDGCYVCGSGSSNVCKDYCRYDGKDTFENRKMCQRKGCKISGTASCPTAINRKVCSIDNGKDRPTDVELQARK